MHAIVLKPKVYYYLSQETDLPTQMTTTTSLVSLKSIVIPWSMQLSTSSRTPFDEFLANIRCRYPSLTVTSHASSDGHWAIIEGFTSTSSPLESKMPTRNPRMIVHAPCEDPSHISYKFEAHFVLLYQGLITDTQFGVLLQSLLLGSNYHLCPGLPQELRVRVDFECKSARKWGFPLQRTDHVNCQLWFHVQVTPRLRQEPTCRKCKTLAKYLRKMVKTRASVSPTRKARHALPSSRCLWKYLSPVTRHLRQSRARKEKSSTKKKLDKCYRYDISVGEATHRELLELVSAFQKKSKLSLKPCLLKLMVQERATFSGRSGSKMSRNIRLSTKTKDKMVSDNKWWC